MLRGVGVVCANCRQPGSRRITADDRAFLDIYCRKGTTELPATAGAARPGGAVEALLRGALEEFAERPFRSYRYLSAIIRPSTNGGGPR